ncbi:hypothetical protein [Methylobacterium komagatae]
MELGDKVKIRDPEEARENGIDKDAVGFVIKVYDLPANPGRADVQFEGHQPLIGWHQSRFVGAESND